MLARHRRRRGLGGRKAFELTPRQSVLAVLAKRARSAGKLMRKAGGRSFATYLEEEFPDAAERREVRADRQWCLDEVANWLEQEFGLSVREDGLLEIWRADPATRFLSRGLPVVLYHHTATGTGGQLERTIRREGLRRDVPRADVLSSGAGVYLTSEVSGPAVSGYLAKARRKHGGCELSLPVVVPDVAALDPDPDDRGIKSGATQWVVPFVPPEAILWEDDA